MPKVTKLVGLKVEFRWNSTFFSFPSASMNPMETQGNFHHAEVLQSQACVCTFTISVLYIHKQYTL